MYIDSPNFVKRKVLNSHSNPASHFPSQYRLGSEREALVQHVKHQLNEHNSDAQILQRFRRQAQQLKRQKFLAKKNLSSPSSQSLPAQPVDSFRNKNGSSLHQRSAEPQLKIYSKIAQTPNPQHRQLAEYGSTIDNNLAYHYEKLLKSKDKQLKRKQKKLEKSKVVIQQLGGKIEHLKQERRLASKNQQMEMLRINALIEEMNYKIVQNKIAFKEELARLKFQLVQSPPTVDFRKKTAKRDLSIPVFPRDHKRSNKIYDSQRFLQGPSVFYEPPSMQNVDLVQSRIDSNFQSVGKGLGKMKESQKVLESQFQKYKDL